jgi:peroxiredoxin Q/BCP
MSKDFKKANASIIGISGGDEKSKEKFCAKHDLGLTLLTDDGTVGKSYDSYGTKKFLGKTYEGFMRNTFVIDVEKMTILETYMQVNPISHAKKVLTFVTDQA